MSTQSIDIIRSFPAFTVLDAAEGECVRVSVALDEARAVCRPSLDDPSGYVTGVVDNLEGKKQVVFAFLREADVVRILSASQMISSPLSLEGTWEGLIVGMGLFLKECSVHEQRA